MLGKWQWAKCTGTPSMCTGTPSMCTGTPEQESGSGKSVPVHLQCVWVHLIKKVTVAKVYRYTCMKTTRIDEEFDPNVRAHLSINL